MVEAFAHVHADQINVATVSSTVVAVQVNALVHFGIPVRRGLSDGEIDVLYHRHKPPGSYVEVVEINIKPPAFMDPPAGYKS